MKNNGFWKHIVVFQIYQQQQITIINLQQQIQ